MTKFFIVLREAVLFYFTICKRGWWRTFPFLPLPPKKYLSWRLDTAYGGSFKRPTLRVIVKDAYKFLYWRYEYRKIGR